jgi:NAD(P)-dependent dehydrogenase (short-subunit alcohol dehydrogenase family)
MKINKSGKDMSKRIAVVTGSAQGIGREYARALAADGLAVVVADIKLEKAEETAAIIRDEGGDASAAGVDVSDPASAAALATTVRERHGALHVLVNNAALFQGLQMHTPMTVDIGYWRKLFSINLDGCLIVSQALVPLLRESGGGRIVNQSSTAAYMSGGDAYSVSKAAVNALTLGLAAELGRDGITVNAIAPGPIPTEAMKGHVTDAMLEGLLQMTPMGRIGATGDLVHALRYLVSEQAGWITGQILVVDGGCIKRL